MKPLWYDDLMRLCREIAAFREAGLWTRLEFRRILAEAEKLVGKDTYALQPILQQGVFVQ